MFVPTHQWYLTAYARLWHTTYNRMNNLLNRNPPVKAVLFACRKLNQTPFKHKFPKLKTRWRNSLLHTCVSLIWGLVDGGRGWGWGWRSYVPLQTLGLSLVTGVRANWSLRTRRAFHEAHGTSVKIRLLSRIKSRRHAPVGLCSKTPVTVSYTCSMAIPSAQKSRRHAPVDLSSKTPQ